MGVDMRITLSEATRLGYATDSVTGLSVGDALGAQYFMVGRKVEDLLAGVVPPPVWEWTDDTEMACSLVWMLAESGRVEQDRLAEAFAERCEPNRGYGAGAFVILHEIRQGTPWRASAGDVFDGQGSMGNGAAMRVAPLGAYFADDVARAAREAALSAEVTHAHPEGVAGAIAVAVAASVAAAGRVAGARPKPGPFLDAVSAATPESQVRRGIVRARAMLHLSRDEAAHELGNGRLILAQDTVPFTLWVAARNLTDYPQAIRDCVSVGGDIDTTAAIAGGVVAAHTGVAGIPAEWIAAREPLPEWLATLLTVAGALRRTKSVALSLARVGLLTNMDTPVMVHPVRLDGVTHRVVRPARPLTRAVLLSFAGLSELTMYVDEHTATRIGRLWMLADQSRDALIHVPLRGNSQPPRRHEFRDPPQLLDIVIAHHTLQFSPSRWRQVRGQVAAGSPHTERLLAGDLVDRRPPVEDSPEFDELLAGLHYDNPDRFAERIHAQTLFLTGGAKVLRETADRFFDIAANGPTYLRSQPYCTTFVARDGVFADGPDIRIEYCDQWVEQASAPAKRRKPERRKRRVPGRQRWR